MNITAAYLLEHELGDLDRHVQLKGTVPVGTKSVPALLALTDRTVVLVGALGAGNGTHRDLRDVSSLRYERGWVGDSLVIDGTPFGVAARTGALVRELIALGRLRATSETDMPLPSPADPDSWFVEPGTAAQDAWLETRIQPGEQVLAWLETSTKAQLGAIQKGLAGWWRFLLTERRAMFVAVSELGDVQTFEVDQRLDVVAAVGRDTLRVGPHEWLTTLGNEAAYQQLEPAVAAQGVERVRIVARANFGSRASGASRVDAARRLYQRLDDLRVASPADLAGLALCEGSDDAPERAAAQLAHSARRGGLDLGDWLVSHRVADADVRRIIRALLAEEPVATMAGFTAAAHADLRERAAKQDDVGEAMLDIELAEHLLLAGDRTAAADLLEARLELLPDQQLEDILPPREADLAAGQGGQVLRIAVLELLVEARGGDDPDVAALAALARLQPLVPQRLDRLIEWAEGDLVDRARAARALLEPGGLVDEPWSSPATTAELGPLALNRVKHPMTRREGVFGWIQARVAKIDAPDHSAVRDYAERARDGHVVDALTDATLAFGGRAPVAYVSRGEKGLGIHSYEHPDPFVLIGGQHLEEGPYQLGPGELAFAVGAEVAHLRFGHSRVTSSEVWDGTWDVGVQAFSVFGSVLTLGGGGLVTSMLGKREAVAAFGRMIPATAFKRAAGVGEWMHQGVDAAKKGRGIVDGVRGMAAQPPAKVTEIGKEQSELVAIHRVMQLTADRAGLLIAGDLVSAVRALFLIQRSTRDELALAQRHGLLASLSRRDDDGQLLHQDLAVRTAALVSFWLDDEYAELSELLRVDGGT